MFSGDYHSSTQHTSYNITVFPFIMLIKQTMLRGRFSHHILQNLKVYMEPFLHTVHEIQELFANWKILLSLAHAGEVRE